MGKCASGAECKLQNTALSAVTHHCRDCREKVHSVLCRADPEAAENNLFLCFPCSQNNINNINNWLGITSQENTPHHQPRRRGQSLSTFRTQQQPLRASIPPPPPRRPLQDTTPQANRRSRQQEASFETPLFRVGDYVDVDSFARSEGGRAYICSTLHTSRESAEYQAKYVLDKKNTPHVKESRVHPAVLDTTTRRRSSDDTTRPSLLSSNHDPTFQRQTKTKTTTTTKTKKKPPVQQLLIDVENWKQESAKSRGIHPIISYINRYDDRDSENGYLRLKQAKAEGRATKKRLDAYEWGLVLKMREGMDSGKESTRHHNKTVPTTALAFAWGVSVQALNQKKVQVSEDPTLSTNRKKRTDAGGVFSMTTINDNNVLQHTRCLKRRKCRSPS